VSSKASGRSLSRSANPLSNFLGVTHFDREQLQLRRLRFLHESTIKSRIGGIVRIPKQGDLGGLRDKLFHEIQALRRNFPSEHAY
jgi:hypothetical protein